MTVAPPEIVVNGRRFGDWTRASLRKSLDEFARSWDLSFVDRWAPKVDPWDILPGASVDFFAGDAILDTGFITSSNWEASSTGYLVSAQGRSLTGDLVDCAPFSDGSDQVKGLTPGAIVTKICAPFNISVRDVTNDTTPVPKFATELGESAFEAIDRVCRGRGILPMTGPDGLLYLTRSENFSRTVDLPSVPVSRGLEYTEEGRFSEYFVYGQHPGEESFRGDKILNQSGSAVDSSISRHRPGIILAESPASKDDLNKQALWERNVRGGRSQTVRYRLPGVLAPDGDPWEPGMLANVQDAVIRVHGTLLVRGVSHTWDESGQWTDLELTRREAYSQDPLSEPKSGGAW